LVVGRGVRSEGRRGEVEIVGAGRGGQLDLFHGGLCCTKLRLASSRNEKDNGKTQAETIEVAMELQRLGVSTRVVSLLFQGGR
jgi:hypothetical protein